MSELESVHAGMAGTIDVGGDLTVNRLGFGAMRITGPGIWGQPADRDEAKAVLRRAVELGVNFIDTADSYGPHVSEELIGETLHPYPDDLVIATKGGLERTGPGRWPTNGRPEHLIEACEGSLRRLKLEQIPLYQFHRPDPAVPLEDSIGALVTPQGAGQDPTHRAVQRHRGPAAARTATHPDRVDPEPLQRRRPPVGVAGRPLRAGADGLPAVGADPGPRQQPDRAGDGAAPRRDPAADRARLAAGPVAVDPADPGHRIGVAPARTTSPPRRSS